MHTDDPGIAAGQRHLAPSGRQMRMVWQDMSPFPTPRIDAEEEREMRLASQARAGAEWALAALIARYQPPVLRYLTRLTGNPDHAQQLAERIFVRMERRIRGPHGGEHLRLWLLRAATESGLDVLRHPRRSRQPSQLNAPDGPRGLLTDGLSGGATDRLRAGLSKIAEITGSTRRQVRQLIWASDAPASPQGGGRSQAAAASETAAVSASDPDLDSVNPEEALRHRLVRAVLAELPYGDAQCLALHLVAGLNQAEVARALGIRPSAARHRIVQGLQLFAHRYDAAITSLGVPTEIAYAETAERLPAAASVLDARDEVYSAPASSLPHAQRPAYAADMDDVADADDLDDMGTQATSEPPSSATDLASDLEPPAYDSAFPEVYDSEYDSGAYDSGAYDSGAYDQAQVVSAPVVESPMSAPVIVDALPVMPSDWMSVQDVPDEVGDDWPDQPTMVPVLSLGAPVVSPEAPSAAAGDTPVDAPGKEAAEVAARVVPNVPVLTPPYQQ
ncbi:MAG: RNA polymerase sigma factor [Nitrososphaerota archaeon]